MIKTFARLTALLALMSVGKMQESESVPDVQVEQAIAQDLKTEEVVASETEAAEKGEESQTQSGETEPSTTEEEEEGDEEDDGEEDEEDDESSDVEDEEEGTDGEP